MPTGRRGARRRRRWRSSSACTRSRRRMRGSNGPLAPAVSSTLFFVLYVRVKAPDPEWGKEVPQPLKRRRLLRGRACAYLRRKHERCFVGDMSRHRGGYEKAARAETRRPRSNRAEPHAKRERSSSHLGQGAVAVRGLHALAASIGDIFPVMRIVVDGRCAGAARAGAGCAVVLAGERDAVALVGPGLDGGRAGLGGGGEGAGERGGERRGGDGGLGVHVVKSPSSTEGRYDEAAGPEPFGPCDKAFAGRIAEVTSMLDHETVIEETNDRQDRGDGESDDRD